MVLCVFFGFICFVCFLECLYFCFMLFCAFWLSVRFFVCLYFGFIVSVGVLVFFVFTVLFLRFILFCMFRSSVCVFCLILFCVSIESKSRVGTTKWLTTHANRRGAAAAVVTFPLFFIFPWPFFSSFFNHFHNLSSFHLNSRATENHKLVEHILELYLPQNYYSVFSEYHSLLLLINYDLQHFRL